MAAFALLLLAFTFNASTMQAQITAELPAHQWGQWGQWTVCSSAKSTETRRRQCVDISTGKVISDFLCPANRPPIESRSCQHDVKENDIWTPTIGCMKTASGTSIKVNVAAGMEAFSFLVMAPPQGCSPDLGQFYQDISIPESCILNQKVEVAVQLTEIKDILGGRYFRHFLFSCSDLGPDGKVKELSTNTKAEETQANASNTFYAEGAFSLLVVTSADLQNNTELTSATNVKWSQDDVNLVLRHGLAEGSQHRILIPVECSIKSTSHADERTLWLSRTGRDCKVEKGLIDNWTIQSKRTSSDDVTYCPLFPFGFQVREEVTIKCNIHECLYVTDAGQLQGQCKEAFDKYQSCGGIFKGGNGRRRRGVSSPSRRRSIPSDQATSRVISASFTLI